MKKLVLGILASVISLSAAELKCNSNEAKIAFLKLEDEWVANNQKALNALKKNGIYSEVDDIGESSISLTKEGISSISSTGESGTDYVNFKLIKEDKAKKLVVCESTEKSWSPEGETSNKIRFSLQQDSKGNLVAKKAK